MQQCVFVLFRRDVWPNTLYIQSLGKHAVSVIGRWPHERVCTCVCPFFNPTG